MTQKGANRGNTSQQEEFKVVIVGGRGCEKTSLLTVYTKGDFPEWYNEVEHFCDGLHIILVTADLHEDEVPIKKL